MASEHYEFPDTGSRITANRRGLLTAIILFAVGLAGLAWYFPAIALPHVRSNLSNIFGVGILLAFFAIVAAVSVLQLWRLIFEVKAVELTEDHILAHYWNLPPRRLPISESLKLRMNVSLIDPLNEPGFRLAHVLSKGLTRRIVVPSQTGKAEALVMELMKK